MNEFLNKNICGDAVHIMKQLPDNTIDLTITSPPYDCYSDDTEVLTLNGWKLIKDVYIGEKVLTLNPNTKEVYYENVINTFNYKYDGDMINFKNTFLDILVTPNHNMYVEYRDGSPTRERKCFIPKDKLKSSFLKKASDVKVSDLLRLNGFEWIGIEKDFFILPEMELMYNKRILNFSSKKIDMKLWCEFLGLYLSEGSCRGSNGGKKNSYQINIKQKDGISNDYLKSVLDRMPYKYFNYKKGLINNYCITDKQLYEYLKKFGNSYEKYIPSYIKELNKEYLKLFLLSYLIGDGSKKDKDDIFNLNNYNMVKSFSKKMRLDIMDILIKLGYSSCEIKNKFVTVCRSSNYSKISKFKNIISYNGNIVCVEVENNNIIYVKRNNKAFFCGNCLRTYNGKITDEKYNSHYSFPFEDIANELFRITKDGGIVVWVVNDQIVNGGESGSSFRQALKFQEIGFKLYDTMIYHKNGPPFPETNRYSQVFEYMFVLLKGKRPNTINIIKDRENKWAGSTTFGTPTHRKKNGDLVKSKQFEVAKYGSRYNVWYIKNGKGFGGDELSHLHPACVDIETECLTLNGWKKYNELNKNDSIISYNLELDKLEWDVLTNVHVNNYNGDIFNISGRRLSMVVTPNHRNVVYLNGEISIKETNLLKKRHSILTSCPLNDNINSIDPNLAYLLGIIVTDGCFSNQCIIISQDYKINKEVYDKIILSLNILEIEYSVSKRRRYYSYNGKKSIDNMIRIKDEDIDKYDYYQVSYCSEISIIDKKIRNEIYKYIPDKKISNNLFCLDNNTLEKILEGIIDGDGTNRSEKNNSYIVSGKYKEFHDNIQILGFLAGYTCDVFEKGNKFYTQLTKNRYKDTRNSKESLIKKENFNDIVWCPEVKNNGTWVARRNGKIFITGNSFPESLAEDHILSWSKEGDVILDPMVGGGTTSKMSKRNNRNFIGIDLNQNYIDVANKRVELVTPYTIDNPNLKSKFILSRENALLKRKKKNN